MKWCLTLFFLVFYFVMWSQEVRCYDELALEGRVALTMSKYVLAIDKFKAALNCPGLSSIEKLSLAAKIEEATDMYLAELDRERLRALEAKNLAEQSREHTRRQLEQALTESEYLKTILAETEQERDEAHRRAMESEASRLMLLARSEVEAGNESTGLALVAYVLDSLRIDHRHQAIARVFGNIAGMLTSVSLTGAKEQIKIGRIAPGGDQLVLVYRPDTLRRFSGADTICLYNVLSRTRIYIPHQLGKVLDVDFSDDGQRFVAAGKNGEVGIWDRFGREVSSFEAHNDAILEVVFLNGNRILTCSRDRSARIWDQNGNHLSAFQHLAPVYSASLAEEANRLLTRSADKSVKLWDAATGQLLKILDQHHLYVYAGELAPGGRQVLTAAADGKIRLWDIWGKLLHVHSYSRRDRLIDARFTSDGQYILCILAGGRLEVNTLEGTRVHQHQFPAEVRTTATSKVGGALLVGLDNGELSMVDFSGNACMLVAQKQKVGVKSVHLAPGSAFALAIYDNGRAYLLGTSTALLGRIRSEQPQLSTAQRAAFGIRP